MLNLMNHMLAEPFHESIEHGLDRIALAKLFEDLGKWDQAAQLYERGLQEALPEADFGQAVRRLSTLQRRRGDLDAARHLWEKAAADGHIYAHIELAKHHEHRQHDPLIALQWTRSARELVQQDANMLAYMREHWLQEVDHRLERLLKKAGL
jgi:tetratricopeptide (TPR) repeat protein